MVDTPAALQTHLFKAVQTTAYDNRRLLATNAAAQKIHTYSDQQLERREARCRHRRRDPCRWPARCHCTVWARRRTRRDRQLIGAMRRRPGSVILPTTSACTEPADREKKGHIMSRPLPELEGLPGWKLRLLERIQNICAHQAHVLQQSYSAYQPHCDAEEFPLPIWRTCMRGLGDECTELEIQAAAVGLPETAIAQARAAGLRGQRWEVSERSPLAACHGKDPVRAHMVEGIATDVWQLEHMAAIFVEYGLRHDYGRLPPDPGGAKQLRRNMDMLSVRAQDAANVVGLNATERAEIWGRDHAGWEHLLAVTVRRYDDPGLLERWRVFAWSGIEHEVLHSLDDLAAVPIAASGRGAPPPRPRQMIHRVTEVLTARPATRRSSEVNVGAAISAALPHALAAGWGNEPADDPDIRPPEPGVGLGAEL